MSRRAPNPGAERAAQNQATIKSLLKLEPNKICADCKKNKHPRWASWNLGIFICIRCSGIHRGMGTHISRVKSVDLDSWTDEQLQSVLNWGNARANKYWEAKLAPGHTPSESKIENFIRTKYELKRWAMDGPVPDPATLDAAADDDVPLSIVKEKQVVERNESIRKASIGQSQAPRKAPLPAPAVGDLIGSDDPVPVRATSGPPVGRITPKAEPAPPKTTGTKDSLLGLDFLGEANTPPRPASTPGVSSAGAQSRPDLKQSILSLYASVPKPQPPQQQQYQQQGFGGPTSPTFSHHSQGSVGGSMGGFNDAFGSLNIGNVAAPRPAPVDPFASLGTRAAASQSTNSSAFGGLSGGNFFNSKPTQPAQPSHQSTLSNSSSGFGGFGDFSSPMAAAPAPVPKASSAMDDLFDFSAPATTIQPTSPPATQPSAPVSNSVFNLSSPQTKPVAPAPAPAPSSAATALGGANLSGADVWGGNEWSSGPSTAAPIAQKSPSLPKASAPSLGWEGGAFSNTPIVPGSSGGFAPAAPKVTADEEFGGWASSTGGASSNVTSNQGGFGGSDDLFNNVWQ
ncbi:uncharacterized protein TrAFT101_007740 [Trichoderma asperellum]|uniref:Arf-GAP domain-containing protein n=1 Tax=Trichoderma asperellum (strain ATCC 204424 / CBS 433.97 / NBRC 101777) TaxID=1042311 RepID=A0A2T3Z3V1_TRIA4|nr:hypothetical protein M441DRAFT_143738 [Trichoderma asperellum CBS 433.97]PTB39475.1 hypothetical protein M441DRAFT_143738 [Trichoderma asperellum CBS 433.97]UKZ92807.1 hypothetical protein TrAFT101_007740 [Trichoderma asperellum]